MAITYVGAGAVVRGTGSLTPGAPAHAANDMLLYCTGEMVGSDTLTTPSGWTKFSSVNNGAQAGAFGIIDTTGSLVIPAVNWSATQPSWAVILAYRGVDLTLATAFTNQDRAVASTQNVNLPSVARTPTSDGAVCFAMGHKEKGISSDGTTFGVPTTFSGTGTIANAVASAPDGNSVDIILIAHWIQPTAQLIASNGAFTGSIVDSTSRTSQCFIFALAAAVSSPQASGSQLCDPRSPAARRSTELHAFVQVPIELRSIAPPSPFIAQQTWPDFIPRAKSNVQLDIGQATPLPLQGQDQVLTPVDWQYGWDKPTLPVALAFYGEGLDASGMSQLTNFAPYTEYNWPVPYGPRQWNRSFEVGPSLPLRGKDSLLTGGPNNLQWDPPKGRPFPMADRGMESGGLALTLTVLTPPAGKAAQDLPTPARRRAVADFIQGTPVSILRSLTIFPPFQPSTDRPPRAKAFPQALRGYEWSVEALLRGQDVLPFGTKFDAPNPIRVRFNRAILSIEAVSKFLIPVTPPIPPGLGVKHMGRVLLDPANVGEAVDVPFDFISGLAPGEVLLSAITVATLYSGVDANPQAIISAAASVSGTRALQVVTPTIVGNIYQLSCTAITSLQQILKLEAYFAVIPGVP